MASHSEGPLIDRLQPLDDLNAAAPLERLQADAMPVDSFYTRSNFEVPGVDAETWRLKVGGLVTEPAILSLEDVRAFGEVTKVVTLECAGNGRILMEPIPSGAPWGLGAVSVAEFTGAPLAAVLRAAGPADETVEFVFTGLDRGSVEPEGEVNYAFGLDATTALSDGPMLVWAMNGEPLTPEHGAPLRLLVPGAYGMNSVKWLAGITAIDEPFTGHFRLKYRYFGDPTAPEGGPVGEMRVRTLMTTPADGQTTGSEVQVRGLAWSGAGRVTDVAVRVDVGDWIPARLGSPLGEFAPAPWSLTLALEPGDHVLAARATDAAGNTQPLESVWNRNGYGNNVVHRIAVVVE